MNILFVAICILSLATFSHAGNGSNITLAFYGNVPSDSNIATGFDFNLVATILNAPTVTFKYFLPGISKFAQIVQNSGNYYFQSDVYSTNSSFYNPLSITPACMALNCPDYRTTLTFTNNSTFNNATTLCSAQVTLQALNLTSCTTQCRFTDITATVGQNNYLISYQNSSGVQFSTTIPATNIVATSFFYITFKVVDNNGNMKYVNSLASSTFNINGPPGTTFTDGCAIVTTGLMTTHSLPVIPSTANHLLIPFSLLLLLLLLAF
jgi:hypothetical protein